MSLDIAKSVHQRLLNKARESSRTFNELLQYYSIERFIYRFSKTPFADCFTLKGALMLSVWSGSDTRATQDIDLLGRVENSIERITSIIKESCQVDFESDGMQFDADSVSALRITEDAEYDGVRVRLRGNLGNARVHLQIDIGFGDIVVPDVTRIVYPTLLDLPAPELNGYTMESSIAEKFQAMVKLGVLNSRMKDFYDIWMLSRRFDFKGELLAEAVQRTFSNRNTPIPTVFDPIFLEDQTKQAQWVGFIRKSNLSDAPASLEEVVTAVKDFLGPVTRSLSQGQSFQRTWDAPGPWRQ